MTHCSIASVPGLPVVSRPRSGPRHILALSALDADMSKLVGLQKQAEKLATQANQLRASIQQGMSSAGLAKYQSPTGIHANLFTSCRFNIDRGKLKRILRPRQFAAVLKPVTSTVLRVR